MRGLVMNTATGKNVQIGGATYNRLVLSGYSMDRARGILSPPGGAGGAPATAPPGDGRGEAPAVVARGAQVQPRRLSGALERGGAEAARSPSPRARRRRS
jgi:hypothetical protein